MDAFAELLQPLGLGHWLIIAGGILMVVGALGLLIRRSGGLALKSRTK